MPKSVTLQWVNHSSGNTGQEVYRKIDGGQEALVSTLDSTTRSYIDTIEPEHDLALQAEYRVTSYLGEGVNRVDVSSTSLFVDIASAASVVPMQVVVNGTSFSLMSFSPIQATTEGVVIDGVITDIGIEVPVYSITHTFDNDTDHNVEIVHPQGEALQSVIFNDPIKAITEWYSGGYLPTNISPDMNFGEILDLSYVEQMPNTLHPTITNLDNWFQSNSVFNQDISGWDTSNVVSMSGLFGNASAFDQDISNWNVSNVTNMSNMFNGGAILNTVDVSQWCVPKILSAPSGFHGTATTPAHLPVWGTCPRGENLST